MPHLASDNISGVVERNIIWLRFGLNASNGGDVRKFTGVNIGSSELRNCKNEFVTFDSLISFNTRYYTLGNLHFILISLSLYSLHTSSSELWASERFRFSTISVELERFELDDVVARSSYGASVSRDELQPRFDSRDALDDDAPGPPPAIVAVSAAAAAAAASAAATADGPLITSSSSSELC